MAELDGILKDGQEFVFVDSTARREAQKRIVKPNTAKVGDYLRVLAVDEAGKPVEFECAGIKRLGAHSQLLINESLSEPAASIGVVLEHNFHRLFLAFSSGENPPVVDANGDAIATTLCVCIDTLNEAWNSRELGTVSLQTHSWQAKSIRMEWTDDLMYYLGPTTTDIGMGPNSHQTHYGGTSTLFGTLGGDDVLTPTVGRTINVVPTKGFINAGFRVYLVGEYYDE